MSTLNYGPTVSNNDCSSYGYTQDKTSCRRADEVTTKMRIKAAATLEAVDNGEV